MEREKSNSTAVATTTKHKHTQNKKNSIFFSNGIVSRKNELVMDYQMKNNNNNKTAKLDFQLEETGWMKKKRIHIEKWKNPTRHEAHTHAHKKHFTKQW